MPWTTAYNKIKIKSIEIRWRIKGIEIFRGEVNIKDVGCGEVNIINKHPKGLKKGVGWAEFGCIDVGWAELKYMEEIAKVKGPRKCVGWAELSAVARSVEPSYTVK